MRIYVARNLLGVTALVMATMLPLVPLCAGCLTEHTRQFYLVVCGPNKTGSVFEIGTAKMISVPFGFPFKLQRQATSHALIAREAIALVCLSRHRARRNASADAGPAPPTVN